MQEVKNQKQIIDTKPSILLRIGDDIPEDQIALEQKRLFRLKQPFSVRKVGEKARKLLVGAAKDKPSVAAAKRSVGIKTNARGYTPFGYYPVTDTTPAQLPVDIAKYQDIFNFAVLQQTAYPVESLAVLDTDSGHYNLLTAEQWGKELGMTIQRIITAKPLINKAIVIKFSKQDLADPKKMEKLNPYMQVGPLTPAALALKNKKVVGVDEVKAEIPPEYVQVEVEKTLIKHDPKIARFMTIFVNNFDENTIDAKNTTQLDDPTLITAQGIYREVLPTAFKKPTGYVGQNKNQSGHSVAQKILADLTRIHNGKRDVSEIWLNRPRLKAYLLKISGELNKAKLDEFIPAALV